MGLRHSSIYAVSPSSLHSLLRECLVPALNPPVLRSLTRLHECLHVFKLQHTLSLTPAYLTHPGVGLFLLS